MAVASYDLIMAASLVCGGAIKVKTLRMHIEKTAFTKKAAAKVTARTRVAQPTVIEALADAKALNRVRSKTRLLSLSADRLLARLA
jgi:hypothetical protein